MYVSEEDSRKFLTVFTVLSASPLGWARAPTASGSYGSLAGWQADEMQVDFKIFKILYRPNYLYFYFL